MSFEVNYINQYLNQIYVDTKLCKPHNKMGTKLSVHHNMYVNLVFIHDITYCHSRQSVSCGSIFIWAQFFFLIILDVKSETINRKYDNYCLIILFHQSLLLTHQKASVCETMSGLETAAVAAAIKGMFQLSND